jgi:hypothetical protein
LEYGDYLNVPALANKAPGLPIYLEPYLACFQRLNQDRINTTRSVGRIPFTAIISYMEWAGIEDQETFADVLIEIDHIYVDSTMKKQKRRTEQET